MELPRSCIQQVKLSHSYRYNKNIWNILFKINCYGISNIFFTIIIFFKMNLAYYLLKTYFIFHLMEFQLNIHETSSFHILKSTMINKYYLFSAVVLLMLVLWKNSMCEILISNYYSYCDTSIFFNIRFHHFH